MAPSDFALSSLLCEEDNDSISYDDYADVDDFRGLDWNINQGHNQNPILKMKDETEYYFLDLPLQNDARLTLLTSKEHEQNVGLDLYLKRLKDQNLFLVARQQAVDWILKVNAQFNFGPLCAYLSVNYLDRFLAVYELPKDSPWMMQLLSVTCLSLAAKVEETEIPTILDLQVGESRFVFEAKTIQKMELIVLSTLKWRMQSVTPFSFIDSFIRKVNDDGQSQTNLRSLILRSTQIILGLIQGIEFLEFQPSEIAAAVAICVVGVEVEKIQTLALFEHLNKERVLKCVEVVIKSCTMSFGSGTLPESPIGVLEAAILSNKNDDSPTCAKRRRLNNISL
ncbi:putative Cyclin-like superfamily [Helianthus annuus]|uniref:Cyclin-like superfamily n=1 Tax=Helianthus annuus TaxID=4232 RepID=A0A251VHX6_HELAN|nr:cyclin-D4-2 [Helianthus annuus]KAF5818629.1 putative Cyclin-like superfamily [Helianthus annuus]KAJ0604880.1 putative cyclin domain-containing protein [Helianthus annuus]KAJ0618899.1 putative cyclin domain-containing protein [Helianthus annuus]KAJ0777354.1 putative cyclin domain-containing protein [Helianthus annuus]